MSITWWIFMVLYFCFAPETFGLLLKDRPHRPVSSSSSSSLFILLLWKLEFNGNWRSCLIFCVNTWTLFMTLLLMNENMWRSSGLKSFICWKNTIKKLFLRLFARHLKCLSGFRWWQIGRFDWQQVKRRWWRSWFCQSILWAFRCFRSQTSSKSWKVCF